MLKSDEPTQTDMTHWTEGKENMIDVHTHIGRLSFEPGWPVLTAETLVEHMDQYGIQKSVLLTLDSPEASDGIFTVPEAFEAVQQFPDRLIPFAAVDPRRDHVAQKIRMFQEMGCQGFGEHKMGLAIDDPKCQVIYETCGEIGWSVLFHLDPGLNIDENGLPRTEQMLQQYPDTIFIMHGPGWWCEISGDCTVRGGYPKGPITPGGAVDRLLREYPNIYGDLSAGSGHNALVRDPDFTPEFIERNWQKLCFGTDFLRLDQELPIIDWFKHLELDAEKKEAIAWRNIASILSASAEIV